MSYPYRYVHVITGSSGSGKSLASKYLEELGANIVSADYIAKKIVKKGENGFKKIISVFGEKFLKKDGSLNRALLHEELTKNKTFKKELESILHPIIAKEVKKEFVNLIKKNKFPIFYDCPLYFEKNLSRLGYKASILICASNETKIKRIQKRDKLTRELAIKRLKIQLPDSKKKKLADFVVYNNESKKEFRKKIKKLYFLLKN